MTRILLFDKNVVKSLKLHFCSWWNLENYVFVLGGIYCGFFLSLFSIRVIVITVVT